MVALARLAPCSIQSESRALLPTLVGLIRQPSRQRLLCHFELFIVVRPAAEQLRSEVETKAHDMAEQNPTRVHLVEKLEKLVEAYNLGTVQVEAFFEALKALTAEMDEEERRAARENLSQDELAIFDLLTKPEPKLTKAQEVEVKRVSRDLLEKLQQQLAIADWRSKQQTRAAVQTTIRFTLNELPEEPYPEPVWNEKVDRVWAFILARRQEQAS